MHKNDIQMTDSSEVEMAIAAINDQELDRNLFFEQMQRQIEKNGITFNQCEFLKLIYITTKIKQERENTVVSPF